MNTIRRGLDAIKRNWVWLKWPLAVAIVVALFYHNRDGLRDLAWRDFHWPSYLLAFVLAAANVLFVFLRWYLLVRAQGFQFRLRDAYRIGFLGYAFSLIGAGSAGGDLVRAVMIAKEQDSRRAVAVATIFLDRVLGLLTLFMIGAAAALFHLPMIKKSPELRWCAYVLWAGSAGGLLGLALLLHPAVPRSRLLTSLTRIPAIGRHFGELIGGVVLYQSKKRMMAAAIVVSLVGHVCQLSSFFFCAQALQAGAAAPSLSTHQLIIPMVVVVEVVAPANGLGAMEFVVQECYGLANDVAANPVERKLAEAAGFSTALAFRGLTLLISAVGMVYYVMARKQVNELLQESSRLQREREAERLS